MINRPNSLRALTLIAFLAVALLGVTSIWRIDERAREVRAAETRDPTWIAMELQYELQRLYSDLSDYVSGHRTASDISLRFDIAWSRINILKTGDIAGLIEFYDIDDSVLTDLERTFIELEPSIAALSERRLSRVHRAAAVADVRPLFKAYDLRVRGMVFDIAQAETTFTSKFRNQLLGLSHAIVYLGLVIAGLVGIFTSYLLYELRISKQAAREMSRMVEEVQAASRQKDGFMSVISHELRTPLTSILGGNALLKMKYGPSMSEGAVKLLELSQRNGDRLLALVNDILDAQALSAGKVKLKVERVDLLSLVQAAVEDCEHYAAQMNVSYVVRASAEELPVLADRGRISQVLSNLLSNAAKFTHAGDVVEVRVFRSEDHGRVEVVDHGMGIAPVEQGSVFTRFHQVNPGTTGARKSTGLGLSICKQLIDMHSGRIGFDSVEGTGSTFWFSLKLA